MQIIRDATAIVPKPCVATIGFFDGVHAGHRYLIRQVKEIAAVKGLHSALVTFPVHPRKVMNTDYRPELLTTLEEKINLLADTGVDYCLMLDFTPDISQLTAREFMAKLLKERYQVECLVIGYDHRFGHNRSEGFEDYVRYGKEIGIEVIRAQAYTGRIETETIRNIPISSSLIRKLLHEGEVEVAARCLQYDYFLDGTVVGGYQVGRKIGFPTANLNIDNPDKLIPADGVYAVWVTLDKKTYMGMLNIGIRPTIDNGPNRTIEVNILHFHSDIYNKFIRITLIKRTRPELKFSGINELITQLHKDAEEAETILLASKNRSQLNFQTGEPFN
jgi:FMN adenylyltransferase (EC 2.7.7.2)/riboflavin kinase (EC 2.7.1.26)